MDLWVDLEVHGQIEILLTHYKSSVDRG